MDDLPNNEPLSFAGHGTNVAGVMWNCKIMPVKMVGTGRLEITYPFGSYNWDFSTTAFPSDVADAIDYAVNNNAHVINLSYGFADMGWPINEVILRVPLLYDAISNAYANNVVTVVAMGNEFEEGNPINYPAAFAHEVIGVGATNLYTQKADFSSTGLHINVSAPGIGIWTTERAGDTDNPSGTSFAAPIVSGVAGLIISQGLDRSFNLTNDDVRHILEITADDIDPIGFDEETGYGKVNAHSALALLDEPNELYNGTSYGGSTTKTNLNQWIYIGDRWGLAAGTYLNVDRYEVTKHIEFDVPFCSVPEVWIRDRECISMNFASPNDGFPWAEITNLTTTGFDVRYSTYYVRYNSIGQTINKWVPSSISSTKIVYTAIGEPNIAGTAGPITGPSIVCTSNSTFTLHNRLPAYSVNWTKSTNLRYEGGQGTDNYTVKAYWYSAGPGWVEATITGDCGDVIIHKYIPWVGNPDSDDLDIVNPDNHPDNTLCEGEQNQLIAYYDGSQTILDYDWDYSGWSHFEVGAKDFISFVTVPYSFTYKDIKLRAANQCGESEWKTERFYPNQNCGYFFSFSPNPADEYVEISIDEGKLAENEIDNYEIRIYNSLKIAVFETGKTKDPVLRINTKQFQNGVYFIYYIAGGKTDVKQLVVSH